MKLKYIPFIALSFLPLVWFINRPGVLVNGVDTNFPLDPVIWFLRRLYVWNSTSNAGADFSASTAGSFFHLIQVIPYLLGVSIFTVQKLSFIFWFAALVTTSALFFSSIFPKNKYAQFLSVFIYVSNPYMFNVWENVKVANLSLTSALPLYLYLLSSAKTKNRTWYVLLMICSLLIAGAGINPAYIISFFVTGAIYNLVMRFNLKTFVLTSSAIVLLNAYWIIPSLYFIASSISGNNSLQSIGFTSWIDSLSENTSLVNVLRLQGAWDWYAFDDQSYAPLYIPYAINYFRSLPFIAFSYILPTVAFLAFILRSRKHVRLVTTCMVLLVVGVFLGAGTHPPTGVVFRFMIDHLPFFSLFRSPWYIFTPMVTISYAVLIGITITGIRKRLGRFVSYSLFAILLVGNCFYSYPLITGKIFRPSKQDGFYVSFPNYMFEAGSVIDTTVSPLSRIAGYPDDEIERFGWGYVGIESIVNLVSKTDTIFAPLSGTDTPFGGLVRAFYDDLRMGRFVAAQNIARSLAISHILYKHDQPSLSPKITIDSASHKVGEWEIIEFPSPSIGRLFAARQLFETKNIADIPDIVGFLPSYSGAVYSGDSVISGAMDLRNVVGLTIKAKNAHEDYKNALMEGESSRVINLAEVQYSWYQPKDALVTPILEAYEIERFGIDQKTIQGILDGEPISLSYERSDDSYIYFAPIAVTQGDHTFEIPLENASIVRSKTLDSSESILVSPQYEEEKIVYSVEDFDPYLEYVFSFTYQHLVGSKPKIAVIQQNTSSALKKQVEVLDSFGTPISYSFIFTPVHTQSTASIEFVAPATDDWTGSQVRFEDVEGYPLFMNDMFFIQESESQLAEVIVSGERISPVRYRGTVEGGHTPHIIVFSESFSPVWDISIPDGARALHFSINGYANAWYITGAPKDYVFELSYHPQYLRIIGIGVTLLTLLMIVKKQRS